MANPEHLEILRQGVDTWNKWRRENSEVQPDLSDANLLDHNLSGANLKYAHFKNANLAHTDLTYGDLSYARFEFAVLLGANLSNADITGANFLIANLIGANLKGANLSFAEINHCDLSEADLLEANLFKTFLAGAVFGNTNLSNVKNLEYCQHMGPSTIDQRTLVRSGNLPEIFLRGCGLSDEFIKYIPSLFWTPQVLSFYSCFISYSHSDENFAKRLHADLQDNGVRCWFAPEDIRIGDKIRSAVDQSIRVYDKLLVVLSETSVKSMWVEHEIETAFDKETEQGKMVLFPIRIDDAVMNMKVGWAAKIRRERHVGDFHKWRNHNSYKKALERLLRDLRENVLPQN